MRPYEYLPTFRLSQGPYTFSIWVGAYLSASLTSPGSLLSIFDAASRPSTLNERLATFRSTALAPGMASRSGASLIMARASTAGGRSLSSSSTSLGSSPGLTKEKGWVTSSSTICGTPTR